MKTTKLGLLLKVWVKETLTTKWVLAVKCDVDGSYKRVNMIRR